MKTEPSPKVSAQQESHPRQRFDPGIEGEIAAKPDHLAIRLGGARGLWIVLAVLLCLVSSGLMMLLPSKTVDVESVYGGF